MFSSPCRNVVRRAICQNLFDGPLAQNSQVVLSSDFGRDHHNQTIPPGHNGSEQRDDEEKKKPRGDSNHCPFIFAKNALESLGLAGICLLFGLNNRTDLNPATRRRYGFKPSVSLYEYLRQKLIAVNVTCVLPIKSVTFSSPGPGKSAEDVSLKMFRNTAENASNAVYNMMGVAFIESGLTEEGKKFLEQCPNYGQSNYNLGVAHETGDIGGKPDHEKAFKYYKRGAELGYNKAILNLATYFLTGKGHVKRDFDQGKQLLEKAQEMGLPEASKLLETAKLLEAAELADSKLLPPSPILRSSSSAPNMSSWDNDTVPSSFSDLYKENDASITMSIPIK